MARYIGNKSNEIFVGNTPARGGIPKHLRCLKSIRLGDLALDIFGKELDPNNMRPLFLSRQEEGVYDKIMVDRFRAHERNPTSLGYFLQAY